MVKIDYSDIYRMKPDPWAVFNRPASNLAAPNIALGLLGTIGKNDASSLQNAVQATENAGNARAQQSLDRLAQSERDLAGQVQQQQQAKYAEEVNSRNMLLAKSNDIASSIKDLATGEIMNQNPEYAKKKVNDLISQKAGIDTQLAKSTEAIKGNPMYQGTTLVEPVDDSKWQTTDNAQEVTPFNTPASLTNKFLLQEFDGLTEQQANLKKAGYSWNKFLEKYPNTEMTEDKFNIAFDNKKKEHLGIADGARAIEIKQKEAANKRLNLAIEKITSEYDLEQLESKSKTQNDFVKNAGEGLLKDLAIQSGLEKSEWKTLANGIFDYLKKARKRRNEADMR